MLYDELKKFYLLHTMEENVLIFHTSILNFADEMLVKIADEFPFRWVFPENVYYEIQLLERSNVFGKKAKLVRKLSQKRKGICLDRNLEDFYGAKMPFSDSQLSEQSNKIFVFGDQLKLKEFLKHAPELGECYVFFHNRWTHVPRSPGDCIAKVELARQWITLLDCESHMKTIRDRAGKRIKIDGIQNVTAKDCSGKICAGYDQFKNIGEGGESRVYEVPENEDIVLKIYKEALSQNHIKKLECLMLFGNQAKAKKLERVELPESLLYHAGEPIGIAVRRVKGHSLTDAMVDPDIEFDVVEVLQDLALSMLELNLCHMMVVDLDGDNMILDEEKKVHLIDTDSFQVMHYGAGVRMRPHYMHRELVGSKGHLVCEPRHQDFAFGVFMFKLLVCGTYSPLFQKAALDTVEENGLFWGEYEFPYKVGEYDEMEVNHICLEKWKDVPALLQKTFVEAFTFQREYSIGYWMHMLAEAMK